MKVVVITSSLGAGGAEHVLVTLGSEWHRRGHVVTLMTLSDQGSDFFRLPEGVGRVALGLQRPARSPMEGVALNVLRIRSVRRAIAAEQPDVVVSFIDRVNVLTLISTAGLGIPIVVSERVMPGHDPDVGSAWAMLRRLTYPLADAVVVQTEQAKRWALGFLRQGRIFVVPNPLAARFEADHQRERQPVVVAIGRLVPQKNFQLLIRAFALVAQSFPGWRLEIHGEGSERPALERLVVQLGLDGRVILPGLTEHPDAVLRSAEVFGLSSRYEGFPNVLVEAMACGCAVVATDCPSGPAEIVHHENDGLIVPMDDVEAFAAGLRRLMVSAEERRRLGHAARSAVTRFSRERTMLMWDEVLAKAGVGA